MVRQGKRKLRHQGSSAADIKRLRERRERAWNLRMAGATLQDIVNAGIGYNNQQMVSKDLKKSRENFYAEDIESLLVLDLARIDEMQKFCTAALRAGNTSEVRNIMALMQFRRETMGITPETIAENRTSAAQITNNGIMVVQGSTRDYLAGIMEAAGMPQEDITEELKEIEGNSRVIQGEVIRTGIHEQTGEQAEDIVRSIPSSKGKKKSNVQNNPSSNPQKKGAKKFKVVRKASQPGPASPGQPPEAPVSAAQGQDGLGVALGDSILLGELVEARAQQLEHRIEELTSPRLGSLDDPAVIPKELAVPVKIPDHNVPVTSGISYKIPPRKMTIEEGKKYNARRLKKPSTVDHVRTHVHQEEV